MAARSHITLRLITPTRLACALVLGWVAAHTYPVQRFLPAKPAPFELFTLRHIPAPANAASPFGHPYFPYSVIPGGAHSREELQKALAADSVAAGHYSDFAVRNTRVVKLDRDHTYYVSYRVGDKIFWTRHTMTLHKGEMLLFDGVHYARARCGNRLTEILITPQYQVAKVEPDPKIFNAPVAVQMSLEMEQPKLDPAPDLPFEIATSRINGLPDPLNNLVAPFVPDAPDTVDYVPTRHDRATLFALDGPAPLTMLPIFFPAETPSVSNVPEPGTAALGFLALAIAGLVQWARKRTAL